MQISRSLVFMKICLLLLGLALKCMGEIQFGLFNENNCKNNLYCWEYSSISNRMETDPAFADTLLIKNVTNLSPPQWPNVQDKPPCPRRVATNGSISRRSLAPWAWIRNVDENRIPETILESECLCQHCIDFRNTGHLDYNLRVQRIKVNIPVLRIQRGVKTPVSVPVTVACRCDFY